MIYNELQDDSQPITMAIRIIYNGDYNDLQQVTTIYNHLQLFTMDITINYNNQWPIAIIYREWRGLPAGLSYLLTNQ